MKTQSRSGALLCAFFFAQSIHAFAQGSLTPPGAPAPTMKTLDQVEPRSDILKLPGDGPNKYVINQSGSYYLSGNLVGDAFRNGILVNASGVTIDLNGFTISGVPNAVSGIFLGSGVNRIAIVNGTISGWPIDGINGGLSLTARFERLTLSGNGNSPIQAGLRTGQAAVVRDCVATSNTGHGFRSGDAVVFNSCSAYFNTGSGFALSSNDKVTDCVAQGNGSHGFDMSSACVLTGSIATSNGGAGFNVATGDSCALDQCTARGNGDIGINGGNGLSAINCTVSANNRGAIAGGISSKIQGCTVYRNLGSGPSYTIDAIAIGDGSSVTGCTVRENNGNGIFVGSRCQITGNTCDMNGVNVAGAGIYLRTESSRIEGNTVSRNTQGIFLTGLSVASNRIEGNTANDNANTGITIDGGGNTVFKNSARGNGAGNYFVYGGNDVGPISTAAAATSPWANISY